MVGAGVAAIFLLADPLAERRDAHIGELDPARSDAGRLRIQGEDDRATQLVFPDELEFDVVQPVELADGRVEDRPAYRVKVQSARPDASGAFVAEEPFVTLLDRETGEPEGTLSALSASFDTGEAAGGAVKVDLSHMSVQRFSLIGEVRGALRMADGHEARVAAERVDVDGAAVHAPGGVTWSRDDMSLSGEDMSWDGDTGRLDFASDATITLAESPDRLGLELHAPGGLTWNLPPGTEDPRTGSWGELRGPVTGTASDGSRVSAKSLVVDGRLGSIRLVDGASYEREQGGRPLKLTARHIALETDDTGRFAIAQADGSVRLVSAPFAVLPAWMVAESIRLDHERVTAPGEVTWSQEGVVVTGTGLDWDTAGGRLDYARDAQVAVDEHGEPPLAGLRVLAPGGMTWNVPPEATDPVAEAQGELRGRVTGTLPDGTSFATDMLFFDGATRSFRLEGSAEFRRVADDTLASVTAHRVTLGGDDGNRLALVSAEGEVVLLSGDLDVLPARLTAESLQRAGSLVTSPDVVTWTREGVTVRGTGMSYDETSGRLDLHRDAQLTLVDPDSRLTTELAGDGGLTWIAPPDAPGARDGHGELRGRVTGRTSDGSTLDTEHLAIDGPAHTLTLTGASRASLAGHDAPLVVEGSDIVVHDVDVSPLVTTPSPVRWSRGGLSGSGTGLRWSDATGELHLDRDVTIAFAAPSATTSTADAQTAADAAADSSAATDEQDAGDAQDAGRPASEPFVLTARGSLDWIVPPGAADPLRDGHGTLRDGVEGGSEQLGRFRTGLLTLDGRDGTAELAGPGSFERRTPAEHVSLAAQRRLLVRAAPDGTPRHLLAEGGAVATFLPAGARSALHLAGEQLDVDRVTRTVELRGRSTVSQGEGEDLRSISATELLRVVTDDLDEIRLVQGRGGLVCRMGAMEVHGDELAFDVAEDVALLSGHCRLLWQGMVVDAAQVEVHPRAQEFRIVRATITVQG
jgi:hypothetical protein